MSNRVLRAYAFFLPFSIPLPGTSDDCRHMRRIGSPTTWNTPLREDPKRLLAAIVIVTPPYVLLLLGLPIPGLNDPFIVRSFILGLWLLGCWSLFSALPYFDAEPVKKAKSHNANGLVALGVFFTICWAAVQVINLALERWPTFAPWFVKASIASMPYFTLLVAYRRARQHWKQSGYQLTDP